MSGVWASVLTQGSDAYVSFEQALWKRLEEEFEPDEELVQHIIGQLRQINTREQLHEDFIDVFEDKDETVSGWCWSKLEELTAAGGAATAHTPAPAARDSTAAGAAGGDADKRHQPITFALDASAPPDTAPVRASEKRARQLGGGSSNGAAAAGGARADAAAAGGSAHAQEAPSAEAAASRRADSGRSTRSRAAAVPGGVAKGAMRALLGSEPGAAAAGGSSRDSRSARSRAQPEQQRQQQQQQQQQPQEHRQQEHRQQRQEHRQHEPREQQRDRQRHHEQQRPAGSGGAAATKGGMFVRALTGIAAGGSGGAGAGGRNAHGADAGQASGAAAGGGSGGGGGSASASASASGGGGGGGGQRKSVFERLSAGYARLGSGGGSAMDVDQQQQPRSINPAVQRALLGATGTPAAAAAGSKRKASDSHAGGDAAAAAAAEAASAALRGAAITSNGGAAAAAPAAGVAPQQQAAKKVRPAAGTPAAAAGAAAAPGGASSKAAELAALRQMLAAKEAEVRRLQREQADAAADERSVVVFGVARAVTDDVLRAHFSVCGGDAGDAVRRATLLPGRHVPGAPGAYIEFRDSHDAGGGVVPVSRAVLGALGLSGSTLLGHQITVAKKLDWMAGQAKGRTSFNALKSMASHPPAGAAAVGGNRTWVKPGLAAGAAAGPGGSAGGAAAPAVDAGGAGAKSAA